MTSLVFLYRRLMLSGRLPAPMATIKEPIKVLLPLLPDAELTTDNDGQILIYTGLTMPKQTA